MSTAPAFDVDMIDVKVLPPAQGMSADWGPDRQLLDETTIGELEALDATLLSSIASLYFAEAAGEMTVLATAVDSGEVLTVEAVAHKLKGSSYALGATGVARILGEIEVAARCGDMGGAGELVTRLRSGLADTQSALANRASVPTPG